MKTILRLTMLFSLLVLVNNCGGASEPEVTEDEEDRVVREMETRMQSIQDAGGIAAKGVGWSPRSDIAEDIAIGNARTELAFQYNSHVEALKKSAVEQIGSMADVEINEAFSKSWKQKSKEDLKGSRRYYGKKLKSYNEKGKKVFAYHVVYAIDPKTLNGSLFDELEKSEPKLYERFQTSKLYDELKEEMEEYKENQ